MNPSQILTHTIIASAIEVHKNMGPGLLKAVYSNCMSLEFEFRGLGFQREVEVPLFYKKRQVDRFLRLDFLVENQIVLELKSLEKVLPVHEAQLLSYLKLTNKQVGLLINFNVPLLKDGIYRRVLSEGRINNDYIDCVAPIL